MISPSNDHPVNTTADAKARPVDEQERLVLLDVLRGVAVLGILVVNIFAFAYPISDSFYEDFLSTLSRGDQWLCATLAILVQGKIVTLFSLLFGMGIALQFSKPDADQRWFAKLYRRRLWLLLLIGLLHGLLLWHGDILVDYAVLGFLAVLFRRKSPSSLLRWAIVLLLICFVVATTIFIVVTLVENSAEDGSTPSSTTSSVGESPRITQS